MQNNTNTQRNKLPVEYEPTTPVLELEKTVDALNRESTLNGKLLWYYT
jgi:hypothetical protein